MSNQPSSASLNVHFPAPIVESPAKQCQGRCPGCQKRQAQAATAPEALLSREERPTSAEDIG